jgi:four helix bundle protein
MDEGLGVRIFNFVVSVIKFSKTINYNNENKILLNQPIKSATSVGANYEEAQGASSKADFRNKIKISLKEIRETSYWLKLLRELGIDEKNLAIIIDEAEQLKRILGKITSSSRD